MAKPIPKWVQERVSRIWKKYNSKELTFDMIEKVLSPMDDRNTISVFLNELKKAEWIEIKPSKEDMRKKIYTLKEPNIIMKELVHNGN
ncbi:hypothetical protein J4456_04470 [Candidatus Pacearchaeota archaeon]|nr:hypothetical protein [Candidatus Pacearchaeota archaeon]